MNKVKEIEATETAGMTWKNYPHGTIVKFAGADGSSAVSNPYRIVTEKGLVALHSGDLYNPSHVAGHLYEKVYGVTIVDAEAGKGRNLPSEG